MNNNELVIQKKIQIWIIFFFNKLLKYYLWKNIFSINQKKRKIFSTRFSLRLYLYVFYPIILCSSIYFSILLYSSRFFSNSSHILLILLKFFSYFCFFYSNLWFRPFLQFFSVFSLLFSSSFCILYFLFIILLLFSAFSSLFFLDSPVYFTICHYFTLSAFSSDFSLYLFVIWV